MRVAMVSGSVSRHGGGVSEVVLQLSSALMDKGIEVAVFSPDEKLPIDEYDKSFGKVQKVLIHRIGPRSFGFAPGLTKALRAWDPDIVHLHGIWMYPSVSVVSWSKQTLKPYILSPHGMLSSESLLYSSSKKRLAASLFQTRCFSGASAVHATCDAELQEFREYGLTGHVAVFPNGVSVSPNFIRRSETPLRKTVLSLGRIHPKKNLQLLLRCWRNLAPEFPDWELLIVGPNENKHKEELMEFIKRHQLSGVFFREPVFAKEKLDLMSSSELFVLATKNDNFALTVAESLSCGTPVIATHGAPWNGLVENDCGWWVPGKETELTQAMRDAMSLPVQERARKGAAGRSWVANEFSWPAVSDSAVSVYEWATGEKKRPCCVSS